MLSAESRPKNFDDESKLNFKPPSRSAQLTKRRVHNKYIQEYIYE